MHRTAPLSSLPEFLALQEHAAHLRASHLRDLFAADARRPAGEPARGQALARSALGIHMDFSKQRLDAKALQMLLALLHASPFERRRAAMFAGEHINTTEDRAVLHVALRAPRGATMRTGGQDVVPEVHRVLDQMAAFADAVRSGAWRGHTGRRIRNVVNIGIGGSDLGPQMADDALRHYADPALQMRFVSNIDPDDFAWKTADLDPQETLFIVASKTFTTQETMTNARTARDWSLRAFGGDRASVARHFVAVSTNTHEVREFGIDPANMFVFWDWVGGRFSMDSSVGLSTMIAVGPAAFREMLDGFHEMDEHFRTAPAAENLPVLMGLLAVWNATFLGLGSLAVLPYSQYLGKFSAYLQQLEMESNGKHAQLDGSPVAWNTCPVVWGQPGTNGQHAFYQMIHQGTFVVPCDFIAFAQPLHDLGPHQDMLLANAIAQARVMAFGQSAQELLAQGTPEALVPHKQMEGNRPSTFLLCEKLTPRMLGRLVALYEHKVFTAGALWNIDSFDQWGVELGKKVANSLLPALGPDAAAGAGAGAGDSSTEALVARYRAWRGRGA
ncbi:MAG: glucose-6-phosphate isomerase [Phycisphaerales bacterium]